jgi:hypothetical protein
LKVMFVLKILSEVSSPEELFSKEYSGVIKAS